MFNFKIQNTHTVIAPSGGLPVCLVNISASFSQVYLDGAGKK